MATKYDRHGKKYTIHTNGQSRPLLNWWELTPKEQEFFDYATEESEFFRYKGELYCLEDFTSVNSIWDNGSLFKELGFDAYMTDTFFSAVCVKLVDDGESVIVSLVF